MTNEFLIGDPGDEQQEVAPSSAPTVGFTLNAGQQAALDWLYPFSIGKQPVKRALLEGFAGTGKTFTINRVVEKVLDLHPHINFGMTAPTHKAVRQLYKHSEIREKLRFGTIHSFLGLKSKLVDDPNNKGRMIETFVPDPEMVGQRRIDGINVLIVDEASMLSDELYDHIDDVVRSGRVRVIFMGDGKQIPPVREAKMKQGDAIPFVAAQRQSRQIHLLQLTEIVRQGAGNPIIEYSVAIREQYDRQQVQHEYSHTEDTGVEVFPRDLETFRSLVRKYFCTPQFALDPDYCKVIAWRNDTVDYFNREIRLLINNAETLPRLIKGDKLILDKPYIGTLLDQDLVAKRKSNKIILPNNEELNVIDFEVSDYNLNYEIYRTGSFGKTMEQDDGNKDNYEKLQKKLKVYAAKVRTIDDYLCRVIILHEDSESDYTRIQSEISTIARKLKGIHYQEAKQMWKQFYDMQKLFAWTKYNYCLTAHKSQGSTYDYTISMEWDIDQNPTWKEKNRIRYVAATRARNKLYIMK